MGRSPTWETNRFAGNKEIFLIYRPIRQYTTACHLSLFSARWIESTLNYHKYFFNTYCNIILASLFTSFTRSLSSTFSHQNPACLSHLRTPRAPSISLPRCNHSNIICSNVHIMKPLVINFLRSPVSSSLISSYISVRSLLSNDISLCSSLKTGHGVKASYDYGVFRNIQGHRKRWKGSETAIT